MRNIEITDNLEEVRDNSEYSATIDISPEFKQEVRRDIKKNFLEEEMDLSDSFQLNGKAFFKRKLRCLNHNCVQLISLTMMYLRLQLLTQFLRDMTGFAQPSNESFDW